MIEVLEAENPMTVRQVFYRMVSMGLIGKTEGEYKSTITRLLVEMRRSGAIPFTWLADGTRWMRKPTTYDSVEAALRETARTYRRSLWRDQLDYVEVWCEKEALAGVLVEVTEEYDVPLLVTRGYPSLSYLYTAAHTIADQRFNQYHNVTLYYLGDHDPSGHDIRRAVEEDLNRFVADIVGFQPRTAVFEFYPLAVEPSQIDEYCLPTRPTKQSDSRSKSFMGESVELDAIPPDELRRLVREAIEDHLDQGDLGVLRVAEESERTILANIAKTMGGQAA
jgi:hypothetical protein